MLIFKELRGHGNRYREIKGPMWHRAVNYRIEHRPHDVSGLSGLPGLFVVCLHGDTPTTYAYTRKHKGDATRRIQRGPRHQDSDPNYERGGKGGHCNSKLWHPSHSPSLPPLSSSWTEFNTDYSWNILSISLFRFVSISLKLFETRVHLFFSLDPYY